MMFLLGLPDVSGHQSCSGLHHKRRDLEEGLTVVSAGRLAWCRLCSCVISAVEALSLLCFALLGLLRLALVLLLALLPECCRLSKQRSVSGNEIHIALLSQNSP